MSAVYLSAALVGNFTTRAHNPNVPITPKEARSVLGLNGRTSIA